MPKFKYLFLAILLGSFVSSNNIGYSMQNKTMYNQSMYPSNLTYDVNQGYANLTDKIIRFYFSYHNDSNDVTSILASKLYDIYWNNIRCIINNNTIPITCSILSIILDDMDEYIQVNTNNISALTDIYNIMQEAKNIFFYYDNKHYYDSDFERPFIINKFLELQQAYLNKINYLNWILSSKTRNTVI